MPRYSCGISTQHNHRNDFRDPTRDAHSGCQLPEYPIVMRMFGVGPVLGPQLMTKIGDVRRFDRKQSIVAYAGVDAPPCQSGTFESKNRHISKRGSPRLRKTLFQVMSTIIQHAPANDPVF